MKKTFLGFVYFSFLPTLLSAFPLSPEIVSGSASISETDSQMLIEVSDRAIINYQRFDVGRGESVRFMQPSSSSSVLNRVVGSNPSQILGNITSNGKVFLVNPCGVYFGKDAIVNTGSLVVSTLDILDQDFLEDRFSFRVKEGISGFIHNEGSLIASDIVLMSPHIKNEGVISATTGKVLLASSEAITLSFAGDGLMSFLIEEEVESALIEHLGSIESASEVFITTSVAKDVISSVINTDGLVEGGTLVKENGKVRITHQSRIKANSAFIEGDNVSVEGNIDVTSKEVGGTLHILGDHLQLLGANIDASGDRGGGTVLIGGEYKGLGDIRTALTTVVDEYSLIKANALTTGNGGRVIVWADDTTIFNGAIFARGGELSGNGGFVETSGKQRLGVYTGHVNTLAPNGQAGDWLLDPNTITIAGAGAGTLVQAADCTDVVTALSITPATINAAASNVILCASVSITQNAAQNILMTNTGVGITFQGSGGTISTTLNGNTVTRGGALNFTSTTVSLGGATTLDATNAGGTAAGANITFDSTATINGAAVLTIRTGTVGFVEFGASVGATTPLTNLVFTTTTSSIRIGANITVSGANTLTFNAPVVLTASPTIATTNNNITFNSTTNANSAGVQGLTITTGGTGTVTFTGTVGATSALANLSVTSATITQSSTAKTTGAISYTGSTAVNVRGNVTTSGNTITITGPTVITNAVSFDSTNAGASAAGATISFSSTINYAGSNTLTLRAGTAGNIVFSGAVGGTTAPTNITFTSSAAIQVGGNIRVTGANPLTFAQAVQLTGTSAITSNNANISFSSTLDGAQALTIVGGSGTVTFTGAVGGTTPLTNLVFTSAALIQIASNITVTGANPLSFSTAVSLTGATSTITTTNNNITFSSTINGFSALTLVGGSGSLLFSGAVGGTTALASLTATSATITQSSTVRTTGSVIYTGSTAINAQGNITTSGGLISFVGPVTLSNVSLLDSTTAGGATGGANISFSSTLDGAVALTLQGGTTGTVTFGGTIGNSIPLTSLTVTGAVITQSSSAVVTGAVSYTGTAAINIGGSITTSGAAITFTGPVALSDTPTFNTTSGAATGANISFSSTLNGAVPLVLQAGTLGNISFAGVVGAAAPPTNITFTSAALIQIGANITVSGANPLNFTSPVSLTGASTITSNGANITFSTTVDGGNVLTVLGGAGTVTFTGAVGGTVPLGSVIVTAHTITQSSTVKAMGAVIYVGPSAINVQGSITTSGGIIDFTGPVALTNSNTFDTTNGGASPSGGNINFSGTLNGAAGLTLLAGTSGTITFSGAVGGSTPLTQLSFTSALLIQIGSNITVTSANPLTFPSPVLLTGTSTITDSGNDITFSSTIDGTQELTVVGGSGSLLFSGAIGGTTPLASLIATSATITQSSTVKTLGIHSYVGSTAINIQGNITTTDASIILTGPVALTNTLTFDTTNGGLAPTGSHISFSAALSGAVTLTLQGGTSGTITFGGAIGSPTPLTSLTVTGFTITQNSSATLTGALSYTGSTAINIAGSITTSGGAIGFTGPVAITGTPSFDSTNGGLTAGGANISFSSTVNGAAALILRAGSTGIISFSGAVGGSVPLTNLTFTSAAQIQIGAGIRVTGANPLLFPTLVPVNLTGPSTIASNNANITFSSTINGNNALTIEGGSGTLTFTGAVGGITPLAALSATSATITQSSTVRVVGSLSYTGATAINIAGNLTTSGGVISLTGPVALTNTLTFDSTNGGAVAAGGNIEFWGTLNGAVALTLRAGTFGDVLFDVVIGGVTPLTSLTFTSADLVRFGSNVTLSGTNPLIFTSVSRIEIGADITLTASTNALTFPSPVTLIGPSTITSNNNNITFSSTLNGAEELIIVGGTAATTFTAAIGGITPLTTLTVTSATITQSSSAATTGSFLYTGATAINIGGSITTSGGTIAMLGPVTISGAPTFDTTNGSLEDAGANITFSSTLNGATSITFDAGILGTITFTGNVGTVAPLTNLVFERASFVQIGGNVTVTGANPLIFSEQVVITGSSTITSNGASITFSETLDGSHALTLAGGAGTLTFNGAVGASLAPTSLTVTSAVITQNSTVRSSGAISYTNTGLATILGNISAGSFNQSGGGTVSLSASITAGSTIHFTNAITFNASLSLIAPSGITLDSTMIPSSSGVYNLTLSAASGTITAPQLGSPSEYINILTMTAAVINVTAIYANTIIQNGTETISSNITAPGAHLLFSTPTTVASGTFTIDVTGGSAPGSITFGSTLDGPGGLTFVVGGGNLTFDGAVGGIVAFGNATVTSAQNVMVAADFTGNFFTQAAGGGTTTIAGTMRTSAVTGVFLTGTFMNITGSIITAAAGPVTFQNSNLLSISGSISANGNFSQSGGGPVSLGNTITTTNATAGSAGVSFTNPVTLIDDVVINTSTGGGDITFGASSVINGLYDLSLIAGTGDTSLSGEVGGLTPINVLTVYSAANLTLPAITASSLKQVAGTGTTTLDGAITAIGDAGIEIVGNIFNIDASIETIGKGPIILQNSGLLTISSGASITAAGSFLQIGSGNVNLSGNITAH